MLTTGDMINETYMIDSEIGSGALGVVYRAYHVRLQKYVVLKKIKVDKMSYSRFRIEVDTLKQLRHAYLPNVYDYIESDGDIYTVMDYISGYDLKAYMESGTRFTEQELIKWLRQLCSVLSYLHSQNPPIIHSDIKPDNILIDENGNVCLIDFNIAGGQGLTKEYASPEQYSWFNMYMSGYPGIENYAIDGRSDIYSLGATFYYLMTGVIPNVEWLDMPLLTSYTGLQYSEALAEIVDKMRCPDLYSRFATADEVLRALDNIKRSDSRYKKYIAFQTIGAIIFAVGLIAGVRMIMLGSTQMKYDDYAASFEAVKDEYKQGDYESAIKLGTQFLNNSDYAGMITDEEMAELLYLLGNSAYNRDDYEGAVYYFSEAYKLVDKLNSPSDLYVDYVISLAKTDNLSTALKIIEEARAAGVESTALQLADAQISFAKGEYNDAAQSARQCIDSSVDSSKAAKCYVLLGDIYDICKDYPQSADCYKKASELSESPKTLRSLANAYIKCNKNYRSTDAMYTRNFELASDALNIVYKKYVPTYNDIVTLGWAYRACGKYDLSLRVLRDGISKFGDSCKLYLNIALTCEAMGDRDGIIDNAARASQYSREELVQTEIEELDRLRSMYG